MCHFNVVNVTWYSASSGANFCLITFFPSNFLKFEISYECAKSFVVLPEKSEDQSHFGYWLNVNYLKKKEDNSSTAQIAMIHTVTKFVNFKSR